MLKKYSKRNLFDDVPVEQSKKNQIGVGGKVPLCELVIANAILAEFSNDQEMINFRLSLTFGDDV